MLVVTLQILDIYYRSLKPGEMWCVGFVAFMERWTLVKGSIMLHFYFCFRL